MDNGIRKTKSLIVADVENEESEIELSEFTTLTDGYPSKVEYRSKTGKPVIKNSDGTYTIIGASALEPNIRAKLVRSAPC